MSLRSLTSLQTQKESLGQSNQITDADPIKAGQKGQGQDVKIQEKLLRGFTGLCQQSKNDNKTGQECKPVGTGQETSRRSLRILEQRLLGWIGLARLVLARFAAYAGTASAGSAGLARLAFAGSAGSAFVEFARFAR